MFLVPTTWVALSQRVFPRTMFRSCWPMLNICQTSLLNMISSLKSHNSSSRLFLCIFIQNFYYLFLLQEEKCNFSLLNLRKTPISLLFPKTPAKPGEDKHYDVWLRTEPSDLTPPEIVLCSFSLLTNHCHSIQPVFTHFH